jgi:hypothetical protein
MSVITTYTKDPDATLDYVISWSSWLPTGDTIASAVWSVPAGLTEADASSITTTTTTCWLSGGTVGEVYRVTCRITTAQGRIDDRSISLRIQER